jgi:hypothetical protein
MSTPPVNAPALVLDDDPRLKDTGWIIASLVNGWPAYRRVGRTVYFRIRNLNGAARTDDRFSTVPTGFIPAGADGGVAMFGSGYISRAVRVDTLGQVAIAGSVTADGPGREMSIQWLTDQSFPI